MVHHTGLLRNRLSRIKDDEVWNAANIEASCQGRMSFRIDLKDYGLSSHIRSGTRNLGRGHAARPAPGGPEIDYYRNVRVLDNFSKERFVDFQRLIHGRKCRLTSTTTTSVGEMS